MEIQNLTGHPVKLITPEIEITFKPDWKASVKYQFIFDDILFLETRIPVYRIKYIIRGLPEPSEGKMYIVSSVIFNATSRKDLLLPYGILKANGAPYGCRKLLRKEE